MEKPMSMNNKDRLVELSKQASKNAYSPYSRIRVGAALLCEDGTVFQGSNIENRSYGLTNCAERSAIFAAVSAGKKSFRQIAIYSPDTEYPISPCGACRQVMSEFEPQLRVIMVSDAEIIEKDLSDLLPMDSLRELR
jgi:cytidine deaminase